jgi:cytochrome c6
MSVFTHGAPDHLVEQKMFMEKHLVKQTIKRDLRSLYSGIMLLFSMCIATHAVAADVFNGAKVYAQHCTFCHGTDGGESMMPGMPNFLEGETLMQPDSILMESIRTGKGTMPGFRGILTDDEILDAIAHIRSLQFNQFDQPFDQPLR